MASLMRIMPQVLMIDVVLLAFVSCLDKICCPGVLENNQLWHGAARKLNIVLLLLPPLTFCGFSSYFQSFVFHLSLHLYYGATIREQSPLSSIQHFILGPNTQRSTFISSEKRCKISYLMFDIFRVKINHRISSPNPFIHAVLHTS